MQEEHKKKTAFSTPYGHFEYNRMPFTCPGAGAHAHPQAGRIRIPGRGRDPSFRKSRATRDQ